MGQSLLKCEIKRMAQNRESEKGEDGDNVVSASQLGTGATLLERG